MVVKTRLNRDQTPRCAVKVGLYMDMYFKGVRSILQ